MEEYSEFNLGEFLKMHWAIRRAKSFARAQRFPGALRLKIRGFP